MHVLIKKITAICIISQVKKNNKLLPCLYIACLQLHYHSNCLSPPYCKRDAVVIEVTHDVSRRTDIKCLRKKTPHTESHISVPALAL